MDDPNQDAGGPPSGNKAFGMWKNLTNKTSTFLNKTAESVSKSTQSPAVQKFGASAAEGLSKLSLQAQQGGTYVWNTGRQTTEGLVSRFSPTGLVAMCQAESKEAPCPRVMLVCCTAICAGALASENLFTSDSPPELVAHLADEIAGAHAATLLPNGTTPQIITCVIKHWLASLPEPLLTFKLVPALTSPATPQDALRSVLAELPLVNSNTLHLLLDTCHRIASNSAINDSDAATLAAGLAPCLLWKPAAVRPSTSRRFLSFWVSPGATPPASPAPDYEADYPSGVPKVGGVPLDSAESAVFIQFLTHLISNYRSFV